MLEFAHIFLSCCRDFFFFLQAEEYLSGEAKSVQSLGVLRKVCVDLKPYSCQVSKAYCSGGTIAARC